MSGESKAEEFKKRQEEMKTAIAGFPPPSRKLKFFDLPNADFAMVCLLFLSIQTLRIGLPSAFCHSLWRYLLKRRGEEFFNDMCRVARRSYSFKVKILAINILDELKYGPKMRLMMPLPVEISGDGELYAFKYTDLVVTITSDRIATSLNALRLFAEDLALALAHK